MNKLSLYFAYYFLACGYFCRLLLSITNSLDPEHDIQDDFSILLFSLNFLLGITSKCQTAPIQIMLAVLSGMFSVKYVCKNHQQTANFKVGVGKMLIYNISLFKINPVVPIEKTVPLKPGL